MENFIRLHFTKISVKKRYKILEHLGLDMNLFTLNPAETFLHVAPMGMLGYKQITELLQKMKNKYDRIVGFRPTGWSHGEKSNLVSYKNIKVYSIPYSEHSSFTELREFVAWLTPIRILPTVNCYSEAKLSVCFLLYFSKFFTNYFWTENVV